jgi:hypothetical protein
MHWNIASLDETQRQALVRVSRQGGLDGGPCFYLYRGHLHVLLLCALAGAVSTGLLALWWWAGEPPWWGGMILACLTVTAGLWTLLLGVEMVRANRSDLKPFLLITPKVLLKAGYAHQGLEGYRLKDAVAFSATDQYEGYERQVLTGRKYVFKFPNAELAFVLKNSWEADKLEAVLAAARAGGAAEPTPGAPSEGLELLPSAGGEEAVPPTLDPRTFYGLVGNPFGVGWLLLGATLACLFALVFVGALLIGGIASLYEKFFAG